MDKCICGLDSTERDLTNLRNFWVGRYNVIGVRVTESNHVQLLVTKSESGAPYPKYLMVGGKRLPVFVQEMERYGKVQQKHG